MQTVFDEVRDLAAVRIATYEQRHEDQVVEFVCKRFVDLKRRCADLRAKGQEHRPTTTTSIGRRISKRFCPRRM